MKKKSKTIEKKAPPNTVYMPISSTYGATGTAHPKLSSMCLQNGDEVAVYKLEGIKKFKTELT